MIGREQVVVADFFSCVFCMCGAKVAVEVCSTGRMLSGVSCGPAFEHKGGGLGLERKEEYIYRSNSQFACMLDAVTVHCVYPFGNYHRCPRATISQHYSVHLHAITAYLWPRAEDVAGAQVHASCKEFSLMQTPTKCQIEPRGDSQDAALVMYKYDHCGCMAVTVC